MDGHSVVSDQADDTADRHDTGDGQQSRPSNAERGQFGEHGDADEDGHDRIGQGAGRGDARGRTGGIGLLEGPGPGRQTDRYVADQGDQNRRRQVLRTGEVLSHHPIRR